MGKSERNNGISSNNNSSTGIIPQSHTNKCQNDAQKPSSKVFCINSLVNLLLYVICILSLSISLYLSYRHHELASNVKSLMYLDNKVARIEIDLDELIRKTNNRLATVNEGIKRDSIFSDDDNNDEDDDDDDENDDGGTSKVDFVSKIPVHVFGELSRLKRDVSNLKMARRQRQTGGAQSPNENCLCPPGESLYYYVNEGFIDAKCSRKIVQLNGGKKMFGIHPFDAFKG